MNPELVMDTRDFESKFTAGWNPNAALTTDDMAANLFGPESVQARNENMLAAKQVEDTTGMTEEERRAKGIFTTSDTARADTSPAALNATDNIPVDKSPVMLGPDATTTMADYMPEPLSFIGNVSADTLGGGIDALKAAGRGVTALNKKLYELAPVVKDIDAALGADTEGPTLTEKITALIPDVPRDDTTVSGKFVRPLAQWATGFIPVFAALRPLALAGSASLANQFAAGALASMVSSSAAFDGAETSLLDLVKGTPLETVVPEFMQKEGDDSELEMRMKNGLSDLLGTYATAGFIKLLGDSIKGLKRVKSTLSEGKKLAEATGTDTDSLAKQLNEGAVKENGGNLDINIQPTRQFERGARERNPEASMSVEKPKNPGDTTVVGTKISRADRDALIRTIYGEARGEGKEGWQAVANVVLNRVSSGRYGGKSVSEVVKAKGQFEPWGNPATRKEMEELSPETSVYEDIGKLVDQVAAGALPDNTGGSTHFIAKDAQAALGRKNPRWAQGEGQQIGRHTFYAPEGKVTNRGASVVDTPNAPAGGINEDVLNQVAKAESAMPGTNPDRSARVTPPKRTDLRGGADQLVDATGKVIGSKGGAGGAGAAVPDRIIGSVIQWKNYTSDEQLAGLIDQVTTGIKKKTIGDKQLKAAAEARGVSLKEIQELGGETEDIALRGIATAVLEQQHAKDVLMPLAKQVSLNPTKESINELVNQMALNRQMAKAYQRFASGTGRALRAVQKMKDFVDDIGVNPDTVNRLRQMANDPNTYRNIEALASKLGNLENPAQAGQFLRDVMRTPFDKVFDSIYYFYINALLSSPVTHAVNIAGTAGMMVYRVAEHELAGALGAGRRLVTGGSLDGPAVGEMLFGQTMATRDIWKLVSTSSRQRSTQPIQQFMAEGKQLMTKEASKVEMVRHNPISAASYFGGDAEGLGWKAKAVDGIGMVVGAPTGFLQVTDDVMKIYAYRSRQYAEAYRQAMMDGFSPSADWKAFGNEVNKWMQDPLPDMPLREANIREDMAAAAERYAYESTFTEELGNDVVSRLGKSMDAFAKNVPGGRYVLPFVRTPTNLLRQGLLERTPLAVMHSQMRKDFLEGGAKRDMTLAKIGMGSMALSTVWGYASEGMITGGGPKDPKLRQQWQDAGWKPYSIRVGDTWYEYKRLDPIGYIIGASADLYELSHMAGSYEDEVVEGNQTMLDKIGQMGDAIGMSFVRNITSRTYTQSLADFFSLITGESEGGALEPVQNILSGFVPNLLSFAKQNVEGDTTVEDTRPDPMQNRMIQFFDQTLNKMKARIPGYDAGPALSNPLGESLMRDPRFALGILPLSNQKVEYDPVLTEAWRVRADIRNPDRTLTRSGITVKLTTTEYAELKKTIANEKMWPGGTDGLTTRQYLEQLTEGRRKFQSPTGPISYKEAPEQDGGDTEVFTQKEIIENVYKEAVRRAGDKLLYDDSQGAGVIMRRFQKEQDKQHILDTTPRQMPKFGNGSGGTVPKLNIEVN